MAQLAKRTQTILVHTHGKDKDHHGHQYSPTLAQLQQQHELAERANESYREVGVGSDHQQQDGKCVIPVFQTTKPQTKLSAIHSPKQPKTYTYPPTKNRTKTRINYKTFMVTRRNTVDKLSQPL